LSFARHISRMMMLPNELRLALAEAALKVAAGQAWRDANLYMLAQAAGRPVADFAPATPGDAVDAVEWLFDRAMAMGASAADLAAPVRDRLFDILMRRFEAMEPHRLAVRSIEEGQDRDPAQAAAAHHRHVRAARFALALAGLEADGLAGGARAQGLAVILAQVRAAWRQDGDGDFVKTMATLDKALRRAEETFGRFAGFEAAKPTPSENAAAAPADQVLTNP
jgi:hypothetical protein